MQNNQKIDFVFSPETNRRIYFLLTKSKENGIIKSNLLWCFSIANKKIL